MSKHTYVVINCNVCGVGVDFDSWGSTARETRSNNVGVGWRFALPGGIDLCPEHRKSQDLESK